MLSICGHSFLHKNPLEIQDNKPNKYKGVPKLAPFLLSKKLSIYLK